MMLMMKPENTRSLIALGVVFFSTFACRPVLTIGWGEIGIFVVLLLVLLGPALFRLYKRYGEFRNWKPKKTKEEDK